jgi:ABC-type transport system involved in multi-copper enzyme maturation permease subunit
MNTLFLAARALHVLLGATWLGMAVSTSFFLMPAIQEAGPEGGKVMLGIARRGLDAFIGSVAGFTILSGFYLYWHFTAGFDPGISASMGGRVFGLGGILGLVAVIVGGSVVSRNARKILALAKQAATADPGTRSQLMQQVEGLRKRVATGGRVVAVLLIVTIVLMTLGHYV